MTVEAHLYIVRSGVGYGASRVSFHVGRNRSIGGTLYDAVVVTGMNKRRRKRLISTVELLSVRNVKDGWVALDGGDKQ